MFLMYIFALFPLIIGSLLWIFNKKIVWWEWLVGSGLSFAITGIIHICIVVGMGNDTETWSGHVLGVKHTPYWHASWWETETYTVTVGSGKDERTETRTRQVHKTRTYPEKWIVQTTLDDVNISKTKYIELKEKFGKENKKPGHRPDMDSGDKYDYFLENQNNHFEPVHVVKSWKNKIKSAPSAFSFPKIPENVGFKYPETGSPFRSKRLLGRATTIDTYLFDCMNARLGPSKKVNVIIIGFSENDSSSLAHDQEAKWIGGKKNDLVLCYGGPDNNRWTYVFGWTEEALVKRNLETILLENEINNDILPKIENEIRLNYKIRDWHQFDYITTEPPLWAYITQIILMVVTQVGFWIFAHTNMDDKNNHCFTSNFIEKNNESFCIMEYKYYYTRGQTNVKTNKNKQTG